MHWGPLLRTILKHLIDFLLDVYVKWQEKRVERKLEQSNKMQTKQAQAKEKLRIIKDKYEKRKAAAPDKWPDNK